MDKSVLKELIALNVALEGNLRTLLERESPEALSLARANLDRIQDLFAAFRSEPEPQAERTEAKECEAVAAEEAPMPEPEPKADPNPVPKAAAPEATATETRPVPVDEMLSRREARDLRKAFTLNDKFLFRRELFGGSDPEFADTVELLQTMTSLDEAREYLFDDLQWDPENPVVKDFMAIVVNHFSPVKP